MSDTFMQEVQEEENSIEELEKRIQQSTGVGEAVADDMIRANEEAQALEVDTLKDAVAAYQRQIDELKELYAKNSALVEDMRKMSLETTKGVQDVMKASAQALADNGKAFQNVDFSGLRDDTRAALDEKVNDLNDKLNTSLTETQTKLSDLLQQSDDFAHKENVRVYRNVQAATELLLKKQTEEIKDLLPDKNAPAAAKANGVQIATLILAAACAILETLDAFGVLNLFLH